MPSGTVIDSLVIEIGLDPTKFAGGEKEVAARLKQLIENSRKGAGEIEHRAKGAVETLSSLKTSILGTFAAFMGGMGVKAFMTFITNADAATGRFAANLDAQVESIASWENAIKTVGGSTESVRASFNALNTDIRRFQMGAGGGDFLRIFSALGVSVKNANGELKQMDQLLIEAAGAVQRRHPGSRAEQAAELALIPGMNEAMSNFLLLGPGEVQSRLAQGRRSAPSPADVTKADEYQKATAQLASAVERFSAAVAYFASGPLAQLFQKLTDLIEGWTGKGKHVVTDEQQHSKLRSRFGEPPAFMKSLTGETPKSGPPSALDQAGYIRAEAIKRGMDPNVAIQVAKSEGLYNWKSSIPGEESYGPFQLHYGGRGQKGGLAQPGLGDKFTSTTGLDAADPANWQSGVRFALDEAMKSGWGQWYGWKGDKWAGIPRGGAAAAAGTRGGSTVNHGNSSSETNINQINVQTQASDANGIARDIGIAINRSALASPVASGMW